MQTYRVKLASPVSNGYYCRRAADSVDLNTAEKLTHELNIDVDLSQPYNVGLILGSSGSGKTTLAREMFGPDCFITALDPEKPIIEQFPEELDYNDRTAILSGVGLTQVPCWIRPVKTLSNGQKARAEAAILMCRNELTVIDEWTSVVDRTVAKAMSHCLQKHARTRQRQVIVLSCHYDVIEWLNPDWVIDCNCGEFTHRGLLPRQEKLKFDIREIDRKTWRYFSKYHYLSHRGPPGFSVCYGLFDGDNQIGFTAFSNYVPHTQRQQLCGRKKILHSNRLVIHPDYCGLGLGLRFVTTAAHLICGKYDIRAKFSSIAMHKSRTKDPCWLLREIRRDLTNQGLISGFRHKVRTFCYEFKPNK